MRLEWPLLRRPLNDHGPERGSCPQSDAGKPRQSKRQCALVVEVEAAHFFRRDDVLIGSANATLILEGSSTDATGIDGVMVNGVTYDVTFVNGSYSSVYATNPPTSLNDAALADQGASQLAIALDHFSVSGFNGLTSITETPTAIWALVPVTAPSGPDLPSEYAAGCAPANAASAQCSSLSDFNWSAGLELQTDFAASGESSYANFDYAVFTAPTSTTPLPGAFPFFATGLAGVGLLGWRRKRSGAAIAA